MNELVASERNKYLLSVKRVGRKSIADALLLYGKVGPIRGDSALIGEGERDRVTLEVRSVLKHVWLSVLL